MNKTENSHADEQAFVLRNYQENVFDPEAALRRFHQEQRPARPVAWRRWAAVAASLLCLAVFAAVLIWNGRSVPVVADHDKYIAPSTEKVASSVASFHFDDTPLPEVLETLERHYGVQLSASDSTHHLTGDFRGQTLDEILQMIENVLDIDITQNGLTPDGGANPSK